MASVTGRTGRAAALHRRAAAVATAAANILDDTRPAPADQRRQYDLADRLRRAAEVLAPGWAGASLESLALDVPAGDSVPAFVRVGTAAPLDDARFPALVPLLGTGHLVVDEDATDPHVSAFVRALLLRLLAAAPAGALLVRAVDAAPGTTSPTIAEPTAARAGSATTDSPTADRPAADATATTARGTDTGTGTGTGTTTAAVTTGNAGTRTTATAATTGGTDTGIATTATAGNRTTGTAATGRTVDVAGGTFGAFAALADAGLLPPPATDLAGLRAVLAEAEQWVAPGAARQRRYDRTMLLVIAGLPERVEPDDLSRIAALAGCGHRSGLYLVVAGWPATTVGPAVNPDHARVTASAMDTGTPCTGQEDAFVPPRPAAANGTPAVAGVPSPVRHDDAGRAGAAPLPYATTISIRNAYALLGDPPGTSFAGPGAEPPVGLNAPVLLDGDPPGELVDAVCRRLARRASAGAHVTLATLLPAPGSPCWSDSSADGVATVVGDADGRPVSLGLTELTPHWLVSGRPGSGRADFLTNVLFGLAARYGPDELVLHLVDLADSDSFTEFLQTRRDRSWVPQVRTAALAADREYVRDLFGHLEAELRRREEAGHRAGGQRFAELRQHQQLPRIVCVIDNVQLLFREECAGNRPPQRDRLAVDLAARLEMLARAGRGYGIHLILGGDGDLGIGGTAAGREPTPGRDPRAGRDITAGRDWLAARDSVLGQFPVRVALPGGAAVLEPSNDAAAGLAVGSAVINTAGGLGGPRGATRGHERMVRFPDPLDDPAALAALRHRLWAARPAGSPPPMVFAGYARPLLDNDPCYRAAVAGSAGAPAALLGRAVDVSRTTVAVPLVPAAGRNLVVLGTGPDAVALLVTAVRSVAAHHRPHTARFVVAALTAATAGVAAALATELADRQTVEAVDLAGLLGALADDRPGYLVLFGADGPGGVPDEPLRNLLRDGPPMGRHVLGWWRSVSALGALLDPADGIDKLATLAVVDVPGHQLAPVVGRTVPWSPRPGRVLLWDVPRGPGTVLVPFAQDGEAA